MGVLKGTPSRPSPYDVVRTRAASIPGLNADCLPKRWERIGDVVLIRIPSDLAPRKEEVGRLYREALSARTVVEDLTNVHGPWRVPEVRWLAGGGTETIHVENGVRFKLDVAYVMFSSGNNVERMRMALSVRPGEVIVDLFAGIGYFAVPIAVHSRATRIVACEVNRAAFGYLLENIRLNRAGAVAPVFGDCRETAPRGVADRVILGHFEAEKYLDTALKAAKDRAVLHVHGLHRSLEARRGTPALAEVPLARSLATAAGRQGFEVLRMTPRFLKWYGPHRLHFVLDAEIARG